MNILNKTRHKLSCFKYVAHEHFHNKYLPYTAAIKNYVKYRKIKYEMHNLYSVLRFKTSDTVFILGAGPSLNQISKEHSDIIMKHDSCGINYSFLKEEIVPTFQQMSYERDKVAQEFIIRHLAPRKKKLKDTVFFLNDKAYYRLGHPRITPFFFPEEPRCCFYKLPKPINLEKLRPFTDEDFDRTVFYRGTLTIVLELTLKLGYKNIILLGVDPDTPEHFFDNMDEMREYCAYNDQYWDPNKHKVYENMVPKGNMFNTIDNYLYALKDYLLRKRGVNLFVGFKNNMLYPKIPAYFE